MMSGSVRFVLRSMIKLVLFEFVSCENPARELLSKPVGFALETLAETLF